MQDYLNDIQQILSSDTPPDQMNRRMRDALQFYTARRMHQINGEFRVVKQRVTLLWNGAKFVIVAVAAWVINAILGIVQIK